MTEYWKSNARKFCDFCKCWLADNKISISYHENGKKHKDNVKLHISKLTKKSVKEFKQQAKIDDEMRKMEEAAMSAYLKDVQHNADVDITSQNLNAMLGDEGVTIKELTKKTGPPEPSWHEVKSDKEKTYFWNIETNETRWDAPESYLSLAEQAKKKKLEKDKKHAEKEKNAAELEKLKELTGSRVKKRGTAKTDEEPASSRSCFGPAPRAEDPYGGWSTIDTTPKEDIDLQLPEQRKRLILPSQTAEPEQVKFKERKIVSLVEDDQEVVEFKQRKFMGARNVRKKVDDD